MSNSNITVLLQLLQQEVATATELNDVLMQEHSALTHFKAENLEAATQAKTKLIQQYQQLSQQRDQWLTSNGLKPSVFGIDQILKATGNPDVLKNLREQMTEQARKADRQNKINGGIINLSRQHVQRALGVLHGRGNQAKLYGSKGQVSGNQMSHTLAVA